MTIRTVALAFLVAMAACESPRPPLSCGAVPPQTVEVGATTAFAPCFTDPDGDPLRYSVAVSDPRLAEVSVAGNTVTVEGHVAGEATIWVTASDPHDLQAVQTVAVTVEGPRPDVAAILRSPTMRTVIEGDSLTFQFTLVNLGSAPSGPTTIQLQMSDDSIITTGDSPYRLAPTPPPVTFDLSPGGGSAAVFMGFHPWPEAPGTGFWGLCAEPSFPDADMRNNCSRATRVTTIAASRATSADRGSARVVVRRPPED